jgi:hypothetical protein
LYTALSLTLLPMHEIFAAMRTYESPVALSCIAMALCSSVMDGFGIVGKTSIEYELRFAFGISDDRVRRIRLTPEAVA